MAEFKVDNLHYEYNKSRMIVTVWLFNDDSKYTKARIARYDFGRKPDTEDGTVTDRKEKLAKGIYREPFRDGWKFTVNKSQHPALTSAIRKYAFYGWRKDDNGELVPFTYLRHNRKAYGTYLMIGRYLESYRFYEEVKVISSDLIESGLPEFHQTPRFPAHDKQEWHRSCD